jgi:arylsulfatase
MRRAWLPVATALLTACGRAPPPAPHIVLVVCDALRSDHLELHGYGRETAPRLAAWAQGALVFEQATAPSNWTRPSLHALFTGRHPAPDRLLGPEEPLPTAEAVLPDLLARAGYQTAAVTANPFLTRTYGADRGFTEFVELGWRDEDKSGHWKEPLASPAVMDRVEYLLSSRTQGPPLFLYVHLMDTHEPYDPPAELRGDCDPAYAGPVDGSREGYALLRDGGAPTEADARQVVALYDGEVRRTDASLARLRALVAEHLGDRPVVTVVTADHGESLGEEGLWRHGRGLHRGLLAVPLIVDGAGVATRVGARVGLVDLAPTLLALAGEPAPADIDGLDLLAARDVTGAPRPPSGRDLVAYHALPDRPATLRGHGLGALGELAVLRDGWRAERRAEGWRLLEDVTGRDRSDEQPALLESLVEAARAWERRGRERLSQDGPAPATAPDLSPEEREVLEQLGYTGR